MAVTDFNGDGNLDVVAFDEDKKLITMMLGSSGLALAQASTLTVPSSEKIYGLTAADIDNDGDSDVLLGVVSGTPSIDILRNDGHGQLQREKLTAGDALAGFSVADADGDGKPELIADLSQGTVGILRVGTSGPATLMLNLQMPRDSHLFDVDGDGDLDLVNVYSNYVAVANNRMVD